VTLRVYLTEAAKADIRAILRWIEQRSPAGALAWHQTWQQALATLEQRVDDLGLAPESADHREAIRQFIFKTKHGRPYRALFAIRERDVFVLHVRGPGQDLLRPEEFK
jgi:plasmid stabilization system protein ParE